MKFEAKKYNPQNITPDKFLNPPTIKIRPQLLSLIEKLNEDLEETRGFSSRLLIGTELEIFFFCPNVDPFEAPIIYGRDKFNPNYAKKHFRKFKKFYKMANDLTSQMPSQFLDHGISGRIQLEFRTAPQTVASHLKSVEILTDFIRENCQKLSLWPVVHSEHLHISLKHTHRKRFLGGRVDLNEKRGVLPRSINFHNFFSKINPFVLLPEEWDHGHTNSYRVRENGFQSPDDSSKTLSHIEVRKLSSEYAADPVLNLLFSLRAFQLGIEQRKIDQFNDGSYSFEEHVAETDKDRDLRGLLGQSTLSTLCKIVSQYPAVSRRDITIDQVAI